MAADDSEVIVGRIKGPWGLRGELKVEVLSDSPLRFSPGSVLFIGDKSARVENAYALGDGLLVKLDVASTRTEAELLRGRNLTVPRSQIEPLPQGSYYHFQIIDVAVWSDQGEYLGEIKDIISTGSNDVYVVRGRGSKELLVPALEHVILEVDLHERRMTVRFPDGLGQG